MFPNSLKIMNWKSLNESFVEAPVSRDPCEPSPCGPNSQCRVINQQAVCSCQPQYIGSPPACRPECTVSSECPLDQACINQKCVSPCPASCGINTECKVINHSPICSCGPSFTGNPFTRCYLQPSKTRENDDPEEDSLFGFLSEPLPMPSNPCDPSPCGPNAQCRDIGGTPSCSCAPDFNGSPPNCRPECTIQSDCPSSQACMNQKCRDPCPGSCGLFAQCTVINHTPVCSCLDGYTGDAFTNCVPRPSPRKNLNHFSNEVVQGDKTIVF